MTVDLRKAMAQTSAPPSRPLSRHYVQDSIREDDESSEGSSSASSVSSTDTIRPTSTSISRRSRQNPTSWHEYFEQELFLDSSRPGLDATYHVYATPPADPSRDPLFVCHHGAGSSGLSFALLARELRHRLPRCGILSVDARGHGSTVQKGATTSLNLSLDILTEDLIEIINLTISRLAWSRLPNTILIGHSLGGAVVSRIAKDGRLGQQLLGFAIIDIVEGSALEALKVMQTYLSTRPRSFRSIEEAVDWHVRTRTIRNPESAAISAPALLIPQSESEWVWRTDLSSTSEFWEGWFTGLSSAFLTGKAAKLLILAGTDRLDKELMIGQMQGKFQLLVFPEAGHFVQEDVPGRTGDALVEFFHRNDRSSLVLPPKVSDLLAQGKKV